MNYFTGESNILEINSIFLYQLLNIILFYFCRTLRQDISLNYLHNQPQVLFSFVLKQRALQLINQANKHSSDYIANVTGALHGTSRRVQIS